MSETIPVGSRWRDNDKRMTRTVVVEKVAGDFVWYRGAVASRSFIPRFLKAFTRIDNDSEQWVRDLIAAGWRERRINTWVCPDGLLWRGPYGAWCELQRRKAGKR
jgi:hypothetical protein